jgi:hypothetical protein
MSYRKHTEGKKPWTTGKAAKAVRVPALKTWGHKLKPQYSQWKKRKKKKSSSHSQQKSIYFMVLLICHSKNNKSKSYCKKDQWLCWARCGVGLTGKGHKRTYWGNENIVHLVTQAYVIGKIVINFIDLNCYLYLSI